MAREAVAQGLIGEGEPLDNAYEESVCAADEPHREDALTLTRVPVTASRVTRQGA